MRDAGTAQGSGELEEIDELCAGIERAVQGADWAAAGTLLSHRRAALERIFSAPACAPPQALSALAERVRTSDAAIRPQLATARDEAAAALKSIQCKRDVSHAYDAGP